MPKLILSLFLLAALGGCGQKGPLYEEKAPETNQTTPLDSNKQAESK